MKLFVDEGEAKGARLKACFTWRRAVMLAYVVSLKMGTSLVKGWYSALSAEDVSCVLGKCIIFCVHSRGIYNTKHRYDANVSVKYKMEIYI